MEKDVYEFDLIMLGTTNPNKPVSKRSLLSTIAKLFDLFDLASPIIVGAMIFSKNSAKVRLVGMMRLLQK